MSCVSDGKGYCYRDVAECTTKAGNSAALVATAQVPDVPLLYMGACYGSKVAQRPQQLLTRELAAIIAEADWAKLWVCCLVRLLCASRGWPGVMLYGFSGCDSAQQSDTVA